MIWIILIILVVWYFSAQKNKAQIPEILEVPISEETQKIDEDTVSRVEVAFEKKLEDEIDFPDAIRGIFIYTYRNQVRVWYKKLSADYRYDDVMTQKLRTDWLDYMDLMKERHTCFYLSMENFDPKDSKKPDLYGDRAAIAAKKMVAIEDAFASAVGKEAVLDLARVRNLGVGFFDKFGNPAPEGFEFDFMGELRPRED